MHKGNSAVGAEERRAICAACLWLAMEGTRARHNALREAVVFHLLLLEIEKHMLLL